jgi:hypothetical protein
MLFATIIINDFASQDNQQQKDAIKLAVFVVDAILSYALTRLASGFVASIEPFWAILAGVIAVYYGPTAVVRGIKLLGIRLTMGRDAAKLAYEKFSANG